MTRNLLLKTGELFGPYRVEALIGSGGMGEVYRVRHSVLDSVFALKVLDPAIGESDPLYVKRFVREAQLAARIKDANLALVTAAGRDDATGLYYLVMEYLAGGSLRERLQKRGAFKVPEALDVVSGIASALVAAEKAGVVHRDIKPDNIMFSSDGKPKLVDLGLAKARHGVNEATITMDGASMGTPAYSAPEQLINSAAVTIRSDIYSLGVVLYELLTGEVPHKSASALQHLARAIKRIPLPDIRKTSKVPDAVATLVADMTNPDPSLRPATAEDALARINGLEASARRRSSGNPVRLGVRIRRFARKSWRIFALMSILAASCLGAYYAGRFNGIAPEQAEQEVPKPATVPLSEEEIDGIFGPSARAEPSTNIPMRVYFDHSTGEVLGGMGNVCEREIGATNIFQTALGPFKKNGMDLASVIVAYPRDSDDNETTPIYTRYDYEYMDRVVREGRTMLLKLDGTGKSELAEHFGIVPRWPRMSGSACILGAVRCGKGLVAAIWLRQAKGNDEFKRNSLDFIFAAHNAAAKAMDGLPVRDFEEDLEYMMLNGGASAYCVGAMSFYSTDHFRRCAEMQARWNKAVLEYLTDQCGFPGETIDRWAGEIIRNHKDSIVVGGCNGLINAGSVFRNVARMTPYEHDSINSLSGDDSCMVELLCEAGNSEYRSISKEIDREMSKGGLTGFDAIAGFLLQGKPHAIKALYDLRKKLIVVPDAMDLTDLERLSNRAAIICFALGEDRMADFRRCKPGISWSRVHPDVMAVMPEKMRSTAAVDDPVMRSARIGDHLWHYSLVKGEAVLWRGGNAVAGDQPCVEPRPKGKIIVPGEIDGHVVVSLGPLAFFGCSEMTEIVLPESLERIEARAFMRCSSLKSLRLPSGVRSIGLWAFNRCDALKSVDLNLCRHLERGNGVFALCPKLESMTVDRENRSYAMKSRSSNIYSKDMKTLVFGAGARAARSSPKITVDEEIEEVGPFAFCDSPSESIVLPKSVKRIGEGAFMNCKRLKELTFKGGAPEFVKGDIAPFAGANENLKIIGDVKR